MIFSRLCPRSLSTRCLNECAGKDDWMKLILASNNQHKVEEFTRVLQPLGYEVISQKQAGIDLEVEETGETFAENARLKAEAVYRLAHLPTIADDSGLEVDALDNAPGVYSARYAGEGATDADRNAKLLGQLQDVPEEERGARFVCVLHFIDENGKSYSLRGECPGRIGYAPQGENGFGYDPIFLVGDKSFAELSPAEKDAVSHRGRALAFLETLLKNRS